MQDAITPNTKSLPGLFMEMNAERRKAVIKDALNARHEVDKELQATLNSQVNAAAYGLKIVPLARFRNPAIQAPIPILVTELERLAQQFEDMAEALLSVWAESHSELHEAAKTAFENHNLDRAAADNIAAELYGSHRDHDEDDIRLMVDYLTNMIEPGDDEDSLDVGGVTDVRFAFAEFLDRMEALPADAPEWGSVTSGLIEPLSDMAAKKIRERDEEEQLEFMQALTELDETYHDALSFLGIDIASWLSDDDHVWTDIEAFNRHTDDMGIALTDYVPIMDTAPTLREEKDRREKRPALEETILAAAQNVSALHVPKGRIAVPETPDAEAIIDSERVQQLIAERDTYKSQAAAAEEKRAAAEKSANELEERIEILQLANSRYERENDKLDTNNKELTGERNTLRAENEALKKARAIQEEPLNVPYVGPEDAKTVRDAVNLARQHYSDRLDIALNTKSDVDIQFPRPYEAWKALEWLATTYYRYRNQEDRQEANLMESLKEACTWDYSRTQSSATVKKYWDAYTTVVGKTTFEVREHISKGNTSPNMIRIAFAWDEERQRVIVGFVGHHQETDAS